MLEAYTYIALLYAKNAELEALSHLDNSIKGNIFPILGCRPGQFNEFSNSIEKYKQASHGLRVGLFIDESKLRKSNKFPARQQFDALFDPTAGFSRFFDFVKEWEAAIPVLCSIEGIYENASEQVENAVALDRGYLVRVRRHESDHFNELLAEGVFDIGQRSFLVDAEWSDDILQSENWMSNTVSTITDKISDAEIVCLSSSFPKGFSHVKGRGVFSNDDREMFERIRRLHNEANLKYGDWGSTRSADESIANTPRPRIDIPTEREWISFRQGDDDAIGYAGVAQWAESDRVWLETPDCWGKRIVELTALNLPQRIKGPQSSNASRINIHLTVQSMAGVMDVIPEEPFMDNF